MKPINPCLEIFTMFYEPYNDIPWYLDGDAAGQDAAAIAKSRGGQPHHVTVEALQRFLGVKPSPLDETEWEVYCDGVNAAADELIRRNWDAAEMDDCIRDFYATYGKASPFYEPLIDNVPF